MSAQHFFNNNKILNKGYDTTYFNGNHYINYQGEILFNSNAIGNDFINAWLFKSRLNQSIKEKTFNQASNKIRLGFNYNHDINYHTPVNIKKDSTPLLLYSGIKNRYFGSAGLKKQGLGLFLFGNQPFAGEMMNFSNTSLTYFNYQEVYGGLEKQITDRLRLAFFLGFIKGSNLQNLEISRGNLFTHEEGEYIDLSLKMQMQRYENNQSPATSFNGFGGEFSLMGKYTVNQNQSLGFSIKDLGVISWKNINNAKIDTNFRFEGITIDNVFSFNDSTFKNTSNDSFPNNLNINGVRKNHNKILPFKLHFNYSLSIKNPDIIFVPGIQYIFNANYFPQFYIKSAYFPGNKWVISPQITYGGFGNLNFGFGLTKQIGKYLRFSFQQNYLGGLIFPGKTKGQGIQIRLSSGF